jgi:hypothetical protein
MDEEGEFDLKVSPQNALLRVRGCGTSSSLCLTPIALHENGQFVGRSETFILGQDDKKLHDYIKREPWFFGRIGTPISPNDPALP